MSCVWYVSYVPWRLSRWARSRPKRTRASLDIARTCIIVSHVGARDVVSGVGEVKLAAGKCEACLRHIVAASRHVKVGDVSGPKSSDSSASFSTYPYSVLHNTNTMADEEVATKAPESDAQQDAQRISGIEGDTKPDQGAASMGVRLHDHTKE
jgi:hypothetical protein